MRDPGMFRMGLAFIGFNSLTLGYIIMCLGRVDGFAMLFCAILGGLTAIVARDTWDYAGEVEHETEAHSR